MPQTLYDKLWQRHCIGAVDGEYLLYIDRHLIHEVTSPQAFAGLDAAGRKVRCPEKTIATMDHSISTRSLALDACGSANQIQLQTLVDNCRRHNILLYPVGDPQQGIVHVMGPELGLVLPGLTVVCTDSHTCTSAWPFGSRQWAQRQAISIGSPVLGSNSSTAFPSGVSTFS